MDDNDAIAPSVSNELFGGGVGETQSEDTPLSYNSLQKYTTSELKQMLKIAQEFGNASAEHNLRLVLAER